jgi:NADPH-dependent 2,4-dienoyl-CoA reductase/sulfur reductase-like enzyme/rhodanese-related sulfurtransferase
MKQKRIVIVGGALAGPTAAARAREVDENARILLLERAPAVSYAIAGLAYHLSGEVKEIAALDQERASFFRANYDVEVRTGIEVLSVDVRHRRVMTSGGAFPWDALVVSTGVESIIPDLPGLAGALNAVPFRNLENLRTILRELRRGNRVVVIGGGHFGIEAADGLARRGAEVVVVERGPRLLPGFAPGASRAARLGLEALGVEVRTGVELTRAERRGARVAALVPLHGPPIPCDLVVIAAGVSPRTRLLRDAGADVLKSGAIQVDEACRTSLPGIVACGTCVAVRHAVSGDLTWLPQASIADKTSQVAGATAAGGQAQLGAMLGTAIVRAGDRVVARTGLAQTELGSAEITRVHPLSRDAYFPGAAGLSIEIAHDPASGRLLAADVWGADGVDKRIDVLATAIAGRLTVWDLARLDLACEPPFGAARDPVNVAGSVAFVTACEPGLAWSPEEVARSKTAVLVDVRSPAERLVGGQIALSRRLTIAQVRASAAKLSKSKVPIVFVSSDGRDGFLAAAILRARGGRKAGFLSGGLQSWTGAGLPLTVTPVAKASATKQAKSPKRSLRPKAPPLRRG